METEKVINIDRNRFQRTEVANAFWTIQLIQSVRHSVGMF